MKNILATGVSGFVGNHLVNELMNSSYSVIGVGGPNTTAPSGLDEYVSIDLTDYAQMEAIDFTSIDYVIHLAGLAAVGPSFDHPYEYISSNMGMEINLFERAIKQKAYPRFLIISSGNVYDPSANLPLSERSRTTTSSPYSVSKLGQEQLASYYSSRGFDCIVARPFNHIGPGQGQGFIVPDLALQIKEAVNHGNTELGVGNLDAQRDYTDVRDIVRAYRLLLEKGRPGEVYNICSGKAVSGHEILDGLMGAAGVKLKPVVDKSKLRPTDNPVIYGSYEKLKKDTGWEPTISLERTLKDVMGSI